MEIDIVHDDFMKIKTGKQIKEFRNTLNSEYRSAEKFAAAIGYSGRQILAVESKKNQNKPISQELSEAIQANIKELLKAVAK